MADRAVIDVMAAMNATIGLADRRGMVHNLHSRAPIPNGTGWPHLLNMREQMSTMADREKQNRWLGWAQCAVVVSGVACLADMEKINKDCQRED